MIAEGWLLPAEEIEECVACLEVADVSYWDAEDEAAAEEARTLGRKLFDAATAALEEFAGRKP